MKRFHVRYVDSQKQIRERDFPAESSENLSHLLAERNCSLLEVKEVPPSLSEQLGELNPFKPRVSIRELTEFTQLLKTLLKAGLPLKEALDILLDETAEKSLLSHALTDVRNSIVEGVSFSKALAVHPDVFPDMFVRTVVAGEKSGALEGVLSRLISYYRGITAVRTKLLGALIYPAILLMVAAAAIIYMLVMVVPEFDSLFKSLDVPLPTYTQIILGISAFLGEWFWILLVLAVLGIIMLGRYQGTPAGRKVFDRLKLSLPVVGNLERRFAYSQFSRTLATLLEGGIPIMESLPVVIETLENKEISARFSGLPRDIERGQTFAGALKAGQEAPQTLVRVVQVGEQSGNLGEMLEGIADHYDEEIATLTATLTALVEPILFLGIAGLVGAIIIALLLPVLTAASSIK